MRKTRLLVALFIVLDIALIAGVAFVLLSSSWTALPWIDQLFPSAGVLQTHVIAPEQVVVGEEFRIVVDVRNTGKLPVRMDEITLPSTLLNNVEVIRVFPQESNRRETLMAVGFAQSFTLGVGEILDFSFTLRPTRPFTFRGGLAVVSGKYHSPAEFTVAFIQNSAAKAIKASPTPENIQSDPLPLQSVVMLTAMQSENGQMKPLWSASGVIISPDGLILTSARVVLPSHSYRVDALQVSLVQDLNQPPVAMYDAVVLQADVELDLAVVVLSADAHHQQVDRSTLNLPAVRLGSTTGLQFGTRLTLLGFGTPGNPLSRVHEIAANWRTDAVTGSHGWMEVGDQVPGSFAGGGVFDDSGALIGVLSGIAPNVKTCLPVVDSNRDGRLSDQDVCTPTSYPLDVFRPIELATELMDAAKRGDLGLHQPVTSTVGLPSPGQVLLQDDFSNPDSGWTKREGANIALAYQEGGYVISIMPVESFGLGTIGKYYQDVILQANAKVTHPIGSGDFGLVCRYLDDKNYYYLAVSEDGYYGIFKRQDGNTTPLVDWTYSAQIPQYARLNLTAACIGATLTLGVNGAGIAQTQDGTFQVGGIGLGAGTAQTPALVVSFDDLHVFAP